MARPMMKCGHTAQGVDKEGNPVCVICYGLDNGATEIAEIPDLQGRLAKCGCGNIVQSDTNLPFFEHRPTKEFDRYYCGCRGWD